MRSFSVASLLLLASCASNQVALQSPPTEVFHSDLSANKVIFCLADKNNATALDQDDGSKVVMIKNIYGAASMTFTVHPEGSGSRIEYRKHFGTVGGVWRQCIGPSAERQVTSGQ